MDLEMILQKFAVFSGLTGDALQACLPYCRDAMQELLARKRAELTATEPLGSAAAALAYYRWCLAQMSGSAQPRIGAAALVTGKRWRPPKRCASSIWRRRPACWAAENSTLGR